MKKIGTMLCILAALAAVMWVEMSLSPRPALSESQLSEQTAINRLERYARPTGASVAASNTTSQLIVTYTGTSTSNTVEVVVGTTNVKAYTYAGSTATADANFTSIALGTTTAGITNADLCNAINSYTGYECAPVAGGDYLGRAGLLNAESVDVTSGGVLAADTVYGISITLPDRGANMANHLQLAGAVMDGLTSAAQFYVYDGDSLAMGPVFARHVPDYDATKISDTELGAEFPWPGLVGTPGEPMVIRVYAHEVWSAAALTVVSNYYGY